MKPTISVTIPTYGRARLVRQTVLAALAQATPPDEIVVSDDCSPDDTCEVIESLARIDSRVRLLRQPKNVGPNRNSNAAINASRGDIIAICCDDDLFLPWHISSSVAELQRRPELGMVHAWFNSIESRADGTVTFVEHPMRKHPRTLDARGAIRYLLQNYSWPFHASTLVFRRSTWNALGGFNPEYELADTDWFLRCAAHAPVGFLAERHVLNRRHPGNLSNAMGSVAMHREVNDIVRKAIDRLPPDPQNAPLRLAWETFCAYRVLRLALARARAGEKDVTFEAVKLALEHAPLEIPHDKLRRTTDRASALLSRLQEHLPGGAAKYSTLGVATPK